MTPFRDWQWIDKAKLRRTKPTSAGRGRPFRPALLKDGKAYVQAGGGWVNDSVPKDEFEETVNKSKAMPKAIDLAETFSKSNPYPLIFAHQHWLARISGSTEFQETVNKSKSMLKAVALAKIP